MSHGKLGRNHCRSIVCSARNLWNVYLYFILFSKCNSLESLVCCISYWRNWKDIVVFLAKRSTRNDQYIDAVIFTDCFSRQRRSQNSFFLSNSFYNSYVKAVSSEGLRKFNIPFFWRCLKMFQESAGNSFDFASLLRTWLFFWPLRAVCFLIMWRVILQSGLSVLHGTYKMRAEHYYLPELISFFHPSSTSCFRTAFSRFKQYISSFSVNS